MGFAVDLILVLVIITLDYPQDSHTTSFIADEMLWMVFRVQG